MLSKNQLKLITSLHQKKYRIRHGLFIVEGIKGITEFLNSSFKVVNLYCTEVIDDFKMYEYQQISEIELKKISSLKAPNKVLGVFEIPRMANIKNEGLILALDGIKDPGNLGTIIRLCDWFGIEQVVCSKETVDCYNSKVVQSTMGSLTRVSIVYADLHSFLEATNVPVYGALLKGENIYKSELKNDAILVIGNESNGISEEISKLISHQITIPRFGKLQQAESLNAATATAIILSEFKSTTIEK
jgi:TrmH family RNA methyltransferase